MAGSVESSVFWYGAYLGGLWTAIGIYALDTIIKWVKHALEEDDE